MNFSKAVESADLELQFAREYLDNLSSQIIKLRRIRTQYKNELTDPMTSPWRRFILKIRLKRSCEYLTFLLSQQARVIGEVNEINRVREMCPGLPGAYGVKP